MKVAILVLLLVTTACSQNASQRSDIASQPATKLEAFQAKTGIVVIRGYTTVGTISGLGGIITVDAREFRDASNPSSRVSGISISVKETSRLETENTSFIDADEIDGLLAGLDYISKASKGITNFEQFEVEYRTKGAFSLTVFNERGGGLAAAVSSGRIGKTTAYIKMADLQQLRTLIASGRSKL